MDILPESQIIKEDALYKIYEYLDVFLLKGALYTVWPIHTHDLQAGYTLQNWYQQRQTKNKPVITYIR